MRSHHLPAVGVPTLKIATEPCIHQRSPAVDASISGNIYDICVTMKTPFNVFKPLAIAACLATNPSIQANELSLARGNFHSFGVDTNARGTAAAVFTPNNP